METILKVLSLFNAENVIMDLVSCVCVVMFYCGLGNEV